MEHLIKKGRNQRRHPRETLKEANTKGRQKIISARSSYFRRAITCKRKISIELENGGRGDGEGEQSSSEVTGGIVAQPIVTSGGGDNSSIKSEGE